ncbi:MAG: serine hydrolase domain-containing protein [Candidatus Acidiferrum sp.]
MNSFRAAPRLSCILFVLLFSGGTCYAQEQHNSLASAVDEVFADFSKGGTPGCAVAIARDGKLVFARGYGLANLEQSLPLTPDSVFDIGSTSKQFSSASILLLEKQGKLSVNDDVRKYIPELPDYGKKITILNLLNHTSGLRDYLELFQLSGVNTDSVTTDDEALALITHQKTLDFDPGSDWLYSNTGFFLLSVIAKRVSGQSLRDFAAENIFNPLGMSHTQYRDSHTLLIPNRAVAYDPIEHNAGFTLDVSYFEQTGDGAVHTTVGDLLKWDENFYSAQVGGKALLQEIQQRGTLNSGKSVSYAKGLVIGKYRGLPTVRHGGSWGGYRAELLRFPEQHFSVVCLCNRSDSNPEKRADQVVDIYLAPVLRPKEAKANDADPDENPKHRPQIPMNASELQQYAADYWSDELGVSYRFSMTGEKLQVAGLFGAGSFRRSSELQGKLLVPVAKDTFEIPDEGLTVRFQRASDGAPSTFVLDAGRTQGMIFHRMASGPSHGGIN